MEQLTDQTSTQSNSPKLMGLLDAIRAKNDLLREGILFIYAIYPQPIKACSLIMTIMEKQEIPEWALGRAS